MTLFGEQAYPVNWLIMRLQLTMMRLLTPEFLHYNVLLAQASSNAVANMIPQLQGKQEFLEKNII